MGEFADAMATAYIRHMLPSFLLLLNPDNPVARNARTHSKKQIRQIADSIETFGWTNPILLDGAGGIIAGHGRIEAAKLLGIDKVPTILLEDLTAAEIRAYIIADNKLAENAGWDRELLAIELQGLIELDIDLDVTITGFEMPEIDILIRELDADEEDDAADDLPAIDGGPPVTRLGDIWCIGKHRLICGDEAEIASSRIQQPQRPLMKARGMRHRKPRHYDLVARHIDHAANPTGRFASESLAGLNRIHWPLWIGMRTFIKESFNITVRSGAAYRGGGGNKRSDKLSFRY